MAKENVASEVGYRFHDQQEYIERYIRFLRAKSTIHDQQVMELNAILRRVHVAPLPTRDYDRTAEPYSPEEMTELLVAIRKVDPEVFQTILGHEQRLDDTPSLGLDGPAAPYLDGLHEWVDYFVDRLSDDPRDEDIEGAIRDAMREAETVDQELDEEDRTPLDALRALLTTAVDHAVYVKIRQRVDAMVYARQQFEEIELLAHVARPDTEINVLRQGFILLMTAFDAAVFDLVGIAFRKKFFPLIGIFGKQEKISLQTIGDAGSFEALRDQMVEEQLKKRYVKDLLGLLQALGVGLVDEKRSDRPVQLVELVLRRNLHVHNRGLVDQRYLEEDPQSKKPKYNLYDLRLGEMAYVDQAYLELANRLCGNCVDRLVEWAGN